MRLIATAKTAFETKESIGPFVSQHGLLRAENEVRAQLTDADRVRATDEHGPLADTRAQAFDTAEQANRGGMRDRHEGFTNQ